jgi:hypothetical protein
VRLLTASVVAVLLIGVFAVVTATLVSVGRLDDVGYPDSSTLLIIREFVRTGHMYLGVHSPPYLVTLYGPLTYAFLSLPHRVAEAAGTSPTVAIRLTLVAGVLMCVALVYSLSRRLNEPSSVSWLCALFALSTPALAAWTMQVRPDFLGLGFALLGVYLFLRSNGHQLSIAAVLCVGLALLFKQTYVAAPAAIFVYLLYRRRWREAAFFSLGVAAVVGGGYLLTLWREPMMLEHLAALRNPAFEARGALVIVLGAIALPVVPFAVAGGVAQFRNGGEAGRLLVLYCVLAWLVATATILQVGGNINYFWEPLFASAVLAGPGLRVLQRRAGGALAAVGGLALALLFALTLTQSLGVLQGTYVQWRNNSRSLANWELLASIVSEKRLLSTDPAITMLGTSPEIPDPYLNAVLERQGRWSSAPVVADLEAARYDLILETGQYGAIFSGSHDWFRGVEFWNDQIRTALMRAYEPVCPFEGRYLWLPRYRPHDPALMRLCVSY